MEPKLDKVLQIQPHVGCLERNSVLGQCFSCCTWGSVGLFCCKGTLMALGQLGIHQGSLLGKATCQPLDPQHVLVCGVILPQMEDINVCKHMINILIIYSL